MYAWQVTWSIAVAGPNVCYVYRQLCHWCQWIKVQFRRNQVLILLLNIIWADATSSTHKIHVVGLTGQTYQLGRLKSTHKKCCIRTCSQLLCALTNICMYSSSSHVLLLAATCVLYVSDRICFFPGHLVYIYLKRVSYQTAMALDCFYFL